MLQSSSLLSDLVICYCVMHVGYGACPILYCLLGSELSSGVNQKIRLVLALQLAFFHDYTLLHVTFMERLKESKSPSYIQASSATLLSCRTLATGQPH